MTVYTVTVPLSALTGLVERIQGQCSYCHGNDRDAPCAYPSQRKPGCLRDRRLSLNEEDLPDAN